MVADAALDDCHALAERHGRSSPGHRRPVGSGCRSQSRRGYLSPAAICLSSSTPMSWLHRQVWPNSRSCSDAIRRSMPRSARTTRSRSSRTSSLSTRTWRTPTFTSRPIQSRRRSGRGLAQCGPTRFVAVGGFDERFSFKRPSVEDIELGHRLVGAGHMVRLDHELRVQHLKRWTFRSLIESDVRDRGIPWTQLILRSNRVHDDLNLRSGYRMSVVPAYTITLCLVGSIFEPRALLVIPAATVALLPLNGPFYRFFVRRRACRTRDSRGAGIGGVS